MKTDLLKQKLAAQRGETLVEALVAILISSLAMLMLATAIGSTYDIVTTSIDTMTAYYDGTRKEDGTPNNDGTPNLVERKVPKPIATSTVTIKDSTDASTEASVQVDVFFYSNRAGESSIPEGLEVVAYGKKRN